MSDRRGGGAALGLLLLVPALGWVLAQLLATAVGRPLIHDEHQFIAPGALLARDGLLPYVDYPHFHMPYLALLYGGVFLVTEQLTLGARLLSFVFGAGVLLLIAVQTWRAFSRVHGLWRGLAALAATALLVDNPLFRQANGLTWNHDGGVLFQLLGLLAVMRARRGRAAARWALLGGVCLAVATGIRLSYAPLAIPFALLLLLPAGGEEGDEQRAPAAAPGWRGVGWLAAGGVLGSLPVFVLMALAPDDFFFGNLGYPMLNTEWYGDQGVTKAMTWGTKLAWLGGDALAKPETLALVLVALAGALSRGLFRDGLRGRRAGVALGALVCLPFALGGAMAPAPSWPQYYAPCIPLLVLLAVHGLGHLGRRVGNERLGVGLVLAAGLVAAGHGWEKRGDPALLGRPDDWATAEVHRVGEQIGERVGAGALVLTEAPVFALEGGARIYGFNANGPFGFRTGHLLDDERRAELGIMIHKDLPRILTETPPDAVLTGSDGWLAKPTRQFVRAKGLVDFALENDFILLFTPAAP